MGTGWRRAFCNSIPIRDHNHGVEKMKLRSNKQQQQQQHGEEEAVEDPTPRSCGKLSFFSNPSTPRLRCRTTTATATATDDKSATTTTPTSAKNSPRVGLALLRALRLSRIGCGICMAGVKTGQGTAVFTAECGHAFHFPCIAAHVRNRGSVSCPVCSSTWLHAPLLALPTGEVDERDMKDYSDDEPLDSLPEDPGEDGGEFRGFFVAQRIVEAELLPEAAVVSAGGSEHRFVVALRIKAPPAPPPSSGGRAPVDLVAVLDVGGGTTDAKMGMLKRAVRLVVASLGPADRLSLVVAAPGAAPPPPSPPPPHDIHGTSRCVRARRRAPPLCRRGRRLRRPLPGGKGARGPPRAEPCRHHHAHLRRRTRPNSAA